MSNHQISKEKDENCLANICKHPKKFQNRILIQTREGNYLVYLYLLAFGSFSELIMILFWIKFSFRRVWDWDSHRWNNFGFEKHDQQLEQPTYNIYYTQQQQMMCH